MTIKCVKIKNGKITKISKGVCNSMKKIDKFLDQGFTITKVTENGNKTKVESFSPRKREPENKWIQEAFKSGKVVEDFEEDKEITGLRKQDMIDKNAYLRGD